MKSIRLKKIIAIAIVASMVPVMLQSGVKAEWKQSIDNGNWSHVDNNGVATNWKLINGLWYNFDSTGVMRTGWINDNGTWYFADTSGAMKTGWVNDKGTWYFTDTSGAMKTGWINDKGTWYFTDTSGSMQTGIIEVDGKVYCLAPSGLMLTGKVLIDNKEYNFSASGEAIGELPKVVKAFNSNGIGVESTANKPQTSIETSTTTSSSNHNSNNGSNNNNGNVNDNEQKKEWNLVWSDEFDGDELDQESWSYEKRNPGWVNNELQEYTDSKENVFVKDGNLVLKAIKTQKDGKDYYTSGKISTQDKKTFKYGKFEIRAKSPEGKGLWPALWMMPNDESLYGQWPKCGEIDIMEILGDKPNTAYGTIHYGDPHEEQQGTYVLDNGTFADDYHVYGVEWEPGEIRFYIDGILYHTANDWFTMVEGGDEVAYPAPFDQEFYMQFNLAVGGSWPGNPNDKTDFDNAEFKVDYIKVYQLDSYDENVKKPEAEEVILRNPDETGNYVINGDFSKDDDSWKFLTALDGKGNYNIADNRMVINTENAGTAEYSIQLVQPGVPLKEGGKYRVKFDAKASEDRTMIVDVSGPDRSYVRYLKDTKVALTTDVETYSYEFNMEKKDDANGRIEFNLGNQGSSADVQLSNIRIEKIGQVEKDENESKKIMPDGNYVNNGTFDVGEDRMKYWEVVSNSKNTEVYVTNIKNSRELKVNVKDKDLSLEDVIVKQTKLALKENNEYVLYFDAYADEDKTITARINGEEFEAELTNKKKTFKFEFETGEELDNKDLELLLGIEGVIYLDNVRVEENSLIRNGAFDSGLIGWEVFVDGNMKSAVSYGVDSLTEKNAVQLEISNTGDADWKVQLKQGNVKLEEGQKYKLSFDAKSTIDRDIMFAIQRDGTKDNNWDAYTGSNVIQLGKDFKTYSLGFKMKKVTDENSIFTISMGAVKGLQITDKHTVTIDNVILEKVDEIDAIPDVKPDVKPDDGTIITNGDFSKGLDGWNSWTADSEAASFSAEDNKAKITIKNTGDANYKVQLKQENIKLEKGKTYKLSFDADCIIDRQIEIAIQRDGSKSGNDWTVYSSGILDLRNDSKKHELQFTMDETDEEAVLSISMGAVNEEQITDEHTITIDNVTLVEVAGTDESTLIIDGSEEEIKDQKAEIVEDKVNDEEVNDDEVIDDQVNDDEVIDQDKSNDKDILKGQVGNNSAEVEEENKNGVITDETKNDIMLDELVKEDQV